MEKIRTDQEWRQRLRARERDLAAAQARVRELLACLRQARRALLGHDNGQSEVMESIRAVLKAGESSHGVLDAYVAQAYQEGSEDAPCPFYVAYQESDNGKTRGVEMCQLHGNAVACMGYPSLCNVLECHKCALAQARGELEPPVEDG